MIFVKVNEKNEVFHIRYDYTTDMAEIDTTQGIVFDELPAEEEIQGKVSVLMHDPETNDLYYKYEDIRPDPKDLITIRIEELEAALVELAALLGGE